MKYLLIHCDDYWSMLLVSEEDFVAKKCYTTCQYIYIVLVYSSDLCSWSSDFKLIQLIICLAKFGLYLNRNHI